MPSSPSSNHLHVIFITTGEYPSASHLHASQVIEPAKALRKLGHKVSWIAVIPLISYIRDKIQRQNRLRSVQRICADEDICFHSILSPIYISGTASFIFRKQLARLAAIGARNSIEFGSGATVLHSRSYYAAQFASELDSLLTPSIDRKLSFDMRSSFPEELPLILKFAGKFLYGSAKQWEYELLRRSHVSFLPVNLSRNRLKDATGIDVRYVPIQGFDREPNWSVDFDRRWSARQIGFAGSLSNWHDPVLLRQMLASIPGAKPKLATWPVDSLAGLDARIYPHAAMKSFYDELLGLVVPGRVDVEDSFVAFQMRCNLFSTKAAEALSRGVPIIVSSQLAELAQFVREHECGAVYDPCAGAFSYPDGEWAECRESWERMSKNAAAVGSRFTRSSVVQSYLGHWLRLFSTDQRACD